MKSLQVLLIPVLLAAGVHADVLSEVSPFIDSSRTDFNPVLLEPDIAAEEPEYSPFSPADSDFGVQQILGTYDGLPPVYAYLDASLNYTNNAPGTTRALDGESWYLSSSLAVLWRPRIACGWFADIGLSQELFAFERSEAVDFENFEPYLGVFKSIPELDDLLFFTRYEYQRVTTGSLSESDYWAQRIRTGLRKNLFLNSRYQLSSGLNAAFDISANEDNLKRDDYSVDVRSTYWLADKLSTTFSWTGSLWDFREGGRNDWSNILGIELTWMPTRNTRVYSNVFYTNHNSNTDSRLNDFESWQTGIGIGINHSF